MSFAAPLPKEAKPRRRAVHSIQRDVLHLIMSASRSQHPKEFGAFMRAEKGVITEILLAPGRIAGNAHTIFSVWNMPVVRRRSACCAQSLKCCPPIRLVPFQSSAAPPPAQSMRLFSPSTRAISGVACVN